MSGTLPQPTPAGQPAARSPGDVRSCPAAASGGCRRDAPRRACWGTALNTPLRLVLIGPHGAGNSTLSHTLGDALQLDVLPEIGRLHRHRAAQQGRYAQTPDPAFDHVVITDELRRDATLPTRVVLETWHPGNLAYSRHRTPSIAARFDARVRRAARRTAGVVVW